MAISAFLDASASLSEALSVGPSVGQSVGNTFVKIAENGLLRILSDSDSARREKRGTRRKE